MVISDCKWIWPDWVFILIQLVVYIPLCWVRKIKHFSFTSLIADVFILLGLAYIFYMDLRLLAARGPAHDIVWFNMTSFPLFVGTAIFAFEGICLILPIAESMQKPQQFGWVLTACIATIAVIFVGIGATSYATFGPKVATIIFLNMPAGAGSGAAIVPTLQFLYGLAIMLSFPLNIYPAIRITEAVIFGTTSTGKGSMLVKWQKNFYRAVLVLFTASVAWLGSDNLDKFVSLVGCFCCIPLSFIYPALFHSRVTRSPMVKIKDISLAVFGCVALIYTTYITLEQMVSGGKDVVIDRCATTHAK